MMKKDRIVETIDSYCNGRCNSCRIDSACRFQMDDILRDDVEMIEKLLKIGFEPRGREKNILKLIAIESLDLQNSTLSKKALKRKRDLIRGMLAAYTALTGVEIGLDTDARQIYERHSEIVIFEWDSDDDA